MDITAVAFDANGTLVKILADDDEERVFRAAAHFLTYQGIGLHRHELRDLYFQIRKEQLRTSPEPYPEFDAAGIWRAIITTHGTDFTRALPAGTRSACSATSTRSSCPATTDTANPTGGSSSSHSTVWRWRPRTHCTSATTCTATSTGPGKPA